jgi:hypothetical protein
MERHSRLPSVQVVPVVQRKELVEQMQVTADLLKFLAVELLHAPPLAAEPVVMATQQVLQVDQVAVAVTVEQADLQLQVKETLEALAYPITRATGLAVVEVALVEQPQHQVLRKLVRGALVSKFHGFQLRLDPH